MLMVELIWPASYQGVNIGLFFFLQATGIKVCGQRLQLVVRSPQLSKNLEAELEVAPISVDLQRAKGQKCCPIIYFPVRKSVKIG